MCSADIKLTLSKPISYKILKYPSMIMGYVNNSKRPSLRKSLA